MAMTEPSELRPGGVWRYRLYRWVTALAAALAGALVGVALASLLGQAGVETATARAVWRVEPMPLQRPLEDLAREVGGVAFWEAARSEHTELAGLDRPSVEATGDGIELKLSAVTREAAEYGIDLLAAHYARWLDHRSPVQALRREMDVKQSELQAVGQALAAARQALEAHQAAHPGAGLIGEAEQRHIEQLLHRSADAEARAREIRVRHRDAAERLLADAELAARLSSQATPDASVTTSSLDAELGQARRELAALERRYLRAHPLMARARQRVDDLSVRYARALQRDLLRAESEHEQLRAMAAAARQRLATESEEAAERATLRDQAARRQDEHAALERAVARLQGDMQAADVRLAVVQKDSTVGITSRTSWLGRESLGALGACLGLLVLGLTPRRNSAGRYFAARRLPVVPAGPMLRQQLLREHAREQLDARQAGGRGMVVLVSPLDPDACESAQAAAEALAGANVPGIVVHADLRRRSLAAAPVGLSTHLLRGVAAAELVQRRASRADAIAAGPPAASAGDLLQDPRMPELLADLASTYRLVVVLGPPPGRWPDAAILAALCDVVTPVLPTRAASTRALCRGIDALRAVNPNLPALIRGVSQAADAVQVEVDGAALTAFGRRLQRAAAKGSASSEARPASVAKRDASGA